MVAGDVAADDTVPEAGALQNVSQGAFNAPVFFAPGVPVVAHPGDGGCIEWRKAFRVAPGLVEGPNQDGELRVAA